MRRMTSLTMRVNEGLHSAGIAGCSQRSFDSDAVSCGLSGHLIHIPPSKQSRSFGAHMTETLVQASPIQHDKTFEVTVHCPPIMGITSSILLGRAWEPGRLEGRGRSVLGEVTPYPAAP